MNKFNFIAKMTLLLQFTLTVFLLGFSSAQRGGTAPNGNTFVCVPPGSCDNGIAGTTPPPNTGGIDPRIVTPGQQQTTSCPAGTISCVTQGPSSRCGERIAVPAPSTADGLTTIAAHPWQAFITNQTLPQYAGSGVLIDNYHILTAAHKVATGPLQPNPPASVTVRMGVTVPSDTTGVQTRTAAKIYVHPNYSSTTLKNDIAIIRVSQPFSLSGPNINSLCLPVANSGSTYIGQNCIVAGWGETTFRRNDAPTNPIKQVNLLPVDYNTCRNGFTASMGASVDTYLDATSEICAGGISNRDACTYDGGAPLTCPSTGKGAVIGLVIWGKNCGQPGVYGVYVNVPFYRTWIDSTIATSNTEP